MPSQNSTSNFAKASPNWRSERAATLQRVFAPIPARLDNGRSSLRDSLGRISRRRHGQPFRSDPARKFAFSNATLYRLYRDWKKGGEVPAAFELKYQLRPPAIPVVVIARFVEFLASTNFSS